ncbi:uncharacterized protein LOC131429325 isoform X2 [Malaya genurostris]|uniref:uncharacterized protein LOC131429325 isoform X2 n=1 Tax=Malaya genurostris TaxID=325434 RepID=UPI0026F3EF1B|nr:uncharacterized protein LOC131429325 isoform X2 [Malaya genurostris]
MGLFGWIKKDTNLHRRRESAPPVSKNITDSVASANRDPAYLEKLHKFNEWRAKQKLERISEGCALVPDRRIPSVIEEEKYSEGGEISDFSSDVEISSEERRVLNRRIDIPKSPRYTRHRQDTGVPKKPKRSVEFYRNINRIPENGELNLNNGKNINVHERFSLPSVMPSGTPRRIISNLSKPNNNTIYENELEEFEQMHMNETLGDTYTVQSPPSRFYKENASPYANNSSVCRTNPSVLDMTPRKEKNLLQKAARSRRYKDKPAPPPPPPPPSVSLPLPESPVVVVEKKHNRTFGSGSESPFAGSYRKYDINSSSIYDEHVISSRAYRGDMKALNSTAKSPASKERRKSPSYQTVVNKHGDLVDYALPFSDTTDTHSELNSTRHDDLMNDIRACEEVINENFRFLNSDIQPSTLIIDDSTSMINEPISVLKERAPQIITDLDRSNHSTVKGEAELLDEVDLAIHEPRDILLELDSLEKWSKSIQLSDDLLQKQFAEKNVLEYFQRVSSQLLICWPKEVHYRVGALRSSFLAPLEFSCGIFRNAPVTLRKYSLNVERCLYFAEEACKKDFELLNHIKHHAIVSLMAVCYDAGLNQATLLLEPFDFTLFDYIHKMNKRLSLLHAITVVQQISLAVSYLQECGYIHSNISSGCILMRRYPYTVKLTSFELTTEASDSIRKEIEERYGSTSSSRNSMTSSQHEELKKITTYSRLIKNDEQFLRDKYRKLSKEVSENRKARVGSPGDSGAYDCRTSRYLPYCKEYREKFSLFYYVAPELLIPKCNFVFPTKGTDVYSLTLLLWEILNGYVPFVVYSLQELEKLQASASLHLPMFEKDRCERFRQVFEKGLTSLNGRKLTVTDILDTLECLLIENGMDKHGQMNGFAEDYEEELNTSEIRKKNELNDIRKQNAMEKTDKIYFQPSNAHTENTNKTTNDLVDTKCIKQQPKKPARKINKTPKQTEIVLKEEPRTKKSPFGSSFNLSHSAIYQTIFDFNSKFLSPRSSKQVAYERTSTVKKHKKPMRTGKRAAKELFEPTTSDNPSESFHRLSATEMADSSEPIPSAKQQPVRIKQHEIIGPLETYSKESPAKANINSEKSKFLKQIIMDEPTACDYSNENQQADTTKSCDSSPGIKRKSHGSKLSNSMRFTIGDITLPDTPIARKNKIRKHAWLSDQKLVISDENTSTPATPRNHRTCSFFNDLDSRQPGGRDSRSHGGLSTPLSLNISSSMQEIKPKRINISVNIIRTPDMGEKRKAHSQEFNKTTPAIVDIDLDKSTSQQVHNTNKAESVHNVFEGTLWKKEKEICERTKLHHSADSIDEEQVDTSASVITAHLTSVRDTVRKIETTFENTGYDYSPNRKLDCFKKPPETKLISEESVVVEENLLIPTKVLELEKTIEQLPIESEPPRAVTRLDIVLTNNTMNKKEELLQHQQPTVLPESVAFNPSSQLFIRRKANNAASVIQRTVYRESIVSSTDLSGLDTANTSQASSTALPPGSARKKKLTTRVTVNMRKISRRASDIGTSPVNSRPNSLNLEEDLPSSGCLTPTNGSAPIRHSCGNDLLKAFAKLRLVPSNEESNGPKSAGIQDDRAVERRSMCTPVKSIGANRTEKFVCCNCGNSMVPADSLNVPTGSRIGMSAAFSELNFPRESLASMFEDNLGFIQQPVPGTPVSRQALAAMPNAKSTEDLYIDDDFCQGLNLGANMELVEFVDDGHYLDEFGYDIYTTEEIYDAEDIEENNRPESIGNEGADEEEQFLSKCAHLNPTSLESIGSEFSSTCLEAETVPDEN